MSYRIRQASIADVKIIHELMYELATYESSSEINCSEDYIRECLFEKKLAEAILLEDNGIVAGFALYTKTCSVYLGMTGIWLEDLFVRPQYRKLGYGKKLLASLARISVEYGCGKLAWSCIDWNQSSIDFYTSLNARAEKEWITFSLQGEDLAALAAQA